MKPLKVILLVFIFITVNGHAQLYNGYELSPWSLMEFSGSVGLQGIYGTRKIENDVELLNKVENYNFSGFASFESKSYIWHPNLVILDIGASYNPSVEKFATIVRPDFATNLDRKTLDVSALFLREKKLSFSTRVNVSESFVNIENINNTRSNSTSFGGSLRYLNNFATISMSYDVRNSKVKFSNTDRVFDRKGNSFKLYSSKSWKWYAKTNLEVIHRKDDNSTYGERRFVTETNRISLTNDIKFTRNNKNNLLSRIDYINQPINGNNDRLSFYERLNLKLNENVNWTTTSNYLINGLGDANNKQIMVNTSVSHQLFNSLVSSAIVTYNNTKSNFVKQTRYEYGISTRYTKKIPLDGTLRLNYTYNKRINNTNGLSNIIEVINEEHSLSDSDVVLLANPYIFTNTIVVKDNTGTLIYEENIDYVLYQIGNFIEIQRLPGSIITDNTTVLISYSSNQTGDYSINSNNNIFSAGMDLFKGIVNFNYYYSNQKFDNSSIINYESENYFKRTGYDGSFRYKFFDGSVQYEKYDSELVPYKRLSYNLNLHGNYRQHMLYSLDYRVDNYSIIQEVDRTEKREFLTGMVAYTFNRNNKLNFMLGYNNRTVNNTSRNWFSGRITYLKTIGELKLIADINFYDSKSGNTTSKYIGGNVSIIRTF
jgi:hypothetical protein